MKTVQTIQGGKAVMLTDHQRAMADAELQHKSAMATLQRKYDQLHESWRLLVERENPLYTLVGIEGATVTLKCNEPISCVQGSYTLDWEERDFSNIPKPVTCAVCQGAGGKMKANPQRSYLEVCSACNGIGIIPI